MVARSERPVRPAGPPVTLRSRAQPRYADPATFPRWRGYGGGQQSRLRLSGRRCPMRGLLLVLLALGLVWFLIVATTVALAVTTARRVSALVTGLARSRGREFTDTARMRVGGYGTGP